MNNISFKAHININYTKLSKSFADDKFFNTHESRIKLQQVLEKVEGLSKLKQDSFAEIEPRVDNNILNLICKVWDSTKSVWHLIEERGARKIANDEEFGTRFVNNIKKNIKNVDKAAKNTIKIEEFIRKSETLENKDFIERLYREMLTELNKGNDPTKRILTILKKIQKEYPNEKNVISIKNIHSQKCSRNYPHFILNNSQGEKKILLKSLLKRPEDNANKLF